MIAVRDVSKIFTTRAGDTVVAIENVTLDVGADEFVTIVGASGCGKSTLLKLIGGLIAPTTGQILLRGALVTRPSRDTGMVFQNPVLLPWRSVRDNILFPIEILGWPLREYRTEADRLIGLVGLRGFEHSIPRELSGGMQQRVSICRALIHDPPLLLMDEPFGALDAMTREELGMELLSVWSERRKTVVFVTHSIPEAILLADRVVVMASRPGRIVTSVAIALPRPRALEMEFQKEFEEYSKIIRSAIAAARTRVS
ncbi:MAG TPA: ABC transporter ATP-binding protein [Candidatus Methylomirabilis sp.]|nr:ABC transporter ATP-binding protein [Candidatus Methylomirabilis sp.]